jgi:hypothetical protein
LLETKPISCFRVLLPPFYNNLGKRITKASKLYMLDPAIVSFLTRQPSADAALSGAMGGALFEGLMVVEAVKCLTKSLSPPAPVQPLWPSPLPEERGFNNAPGHPMHKIHRDFLFISMIEP